MSILAPKSRIFIVVILAISIHLPYFMVKMLLEFKRVSIRKEVKFLINAGLKDEELVKLKFSKSQVQQDVIWEKSDEFEYLGKMYDVVKTIETSDSLYYYCWLDEAESSIKLKLNEWADLNWQHQKNNQENKDKLNDYNKNLICESIEPKFLIFNNYNFYLKRKFPNTVNWYKSPFQTYHSPPPDYTKFNFYV